MLLETLEYLGIAFISSVLLIIMSKVILQALIRRPADYYNARELREEELMLNAGGISITKEHETNPEGEIIEEKHLEAQLGDVEAAEPEEIMLEVPDAIAESIEVHTEQEEDVAETVSEPEKYEEEVAEPEKEAEEVTEEPEPEPEVAEETEAEPEPEPEVPEETEPEPEPEPAAEEPAEATELEEEAEDIKAEPETEFNASEKKAGNFPADDNPTNGIVYDIQEKERFRLSSDLHDNTVQNLVHVCHGLELASMFIDQDPVRAKLEIESCIKNIHNSIDEIREIIFDLRPMELDDLGFQACIGNFIDNMKVSYSNVIFETDIDNIEKDNSFLYTMFMIIKEVVVNSLKHSKSPKIIINVKQKEDHIDIMIKDFGIGFDPEKVSENHFGLHLIKDRVDLLGGSFDVKSSETEGTEVSIKI